MIGPALMVAALLGGCATDDQAPGDQQSSAPNQLRWIDFNGMAIPQAQQGPHNPDPVHPTGFDRSPAGAALAAVNATVRLSVANDEQWAQIVRLNTAPTAGRDWFIQNRIQVSVTRTVNAGEAERVIGYRVRAFNEFGANVDIYTEAPDSSKLVTYTQVQWLPGNEDWGLVLPAATDPTSPNRKSTLTQLPADAITFGD